MIVGFRVDASNVIGTGHVMRCLALAYRLRHAGDTVFFFCRELPGNLCNDLEARGFSVFRLIGDEMEVTTMHGNQCNYAAWLGTTWQLDALKTYSLLEPLAPLDWLVVDHYAIDACWEKILRPLTKKILVIDDLFDRQHDADILVNQNIVGGFEESYQALLPDYCHQLLGPRYALLQNHYQELRNRTPPRNGKVNRILIYFGGVDAPNLTGRSLEALRAVGQGGLHIDVVLPLAGIHRELVVKLAESMSGVTIHDNLPSLAKLLASADLAIGAGGTTSWERLCLGLPSVIITLADNQVMIAESLQANNLSYWLGHHDEVSIETIGNALHSLLLQDDIHDWSARCRATVDGKGVDRIYEFMSLDVNQKLIARHATIEDESLIDDWGIFPDLAESNPYIEMMRNLGDDRLYILEVFEGEIVGSVFCSQRGGYWNLRVKRSPRAGINYTEQDLQEAALRQLYLENNEKRLGLEMEASSTCVIISMCSDINSWINDFIPSWILHWGTLGHKVAWSHDPSELPESQICFYFSYSSVVSEKIRSRHKLNLVVHESDLPIGRGWSPLTWQVLLGEQNIIVSLFEAVDPVDSGMIYDQTTIQLEGDELISDLRLKQAVATFDLCTKFILDYPAALKKKREQIGTPTYFQKRTPADSKLDVNKSLADQFNLLRVCDNDRYPAWFNYAGSRYTISIQHIKKDDDDR